MDLFSTVTDWCQARFNGDSPALREILRDLNFPLRTADADTVNQNSKLAGCAEALMEFFSATVNKQIEDSIEEDRLTRIEGTQIELWHRALSDQDLKVVRAVVEEFLSRYLPSFLENKLEFVPRDSEFRNRRETNAVLDAYVRSLDGFERAQKDVIVLFEVKNSEGQWVANEPALKGFFDSENPAYIAVQTRVKLPREVKLEEDQDTDLGVGELTIISVFRGPVPNSGLAIWTDQE